MDTDQAKKSKKEKISSTANSFCDTRIMLVFIGNQVIWFLAVIPGVNLRDGTTTLNGPHSKVPFYGSVAGFCSPAGLDPGKFWFWWVL